MQAATATATVGATVEQSDEEFGFAERPSGDFIDGFLAGFATANAALSQGEAATFYFSFDWIGDGEEERDESLYVAFQAEEDGMRFEIEPLSDWRRDAQSLAQKWLARYLPPNTGQDVVAEFMQILDAFLAEDAVEVFRITPRPPAGGAEMTPAIGGSYDHLLFETADGRVLLEFAVEG